MAAAGESGGTPFRRLVRSRNFGLLWGSSGLSGVGDQFDLIAFPWLVLAVTGDPVAVGLVTAATGPCPRASLRFAAPASAFGPSGGGLSR